MPNKRPAGQEEKIFIYDDIHPEDGAMLQALYSRSPASVVDHLDKVRNSGSGNFMSKFYVGYGHASIGDCGVTTIFMENYSMLAAKAIQDNPLYSGQEASTRYLDFAGQPMVDPYNHPYTTSILNGWMDIYNKWMPTVVDHISITFPYDEADYASEKQWENAVKARAFDMLRAYLPVGTTTLFSWTTNLRQARDKMRQLKSHPLPEMQQLGQDLYKQMVEKYPNSFTGQEMEEGNARYAERDAYMERMAMADNFQSYASIKERFELKPEEIKALEEGEMLVFGDSVDVEGLNNYEQEALTTRPKGVGLPRRLASYGSYDMIFTLDFGSYRDLQRHRNGVCQIPLMEKELGMYSWYMDELETLLGADFKELEAETNAQFEKIGRLKEEGIDEDPLLTQYLLPMGITCVVQLSYSVPQVQYVAELRSGKPVHQSLRPIAQQMGRLLEEQFDGIKMYIDWDQDNWTSKRGDQTITMKNAG